VAENIGRIYISDSIDNQVEIYTTDGTYVNSFGVYGEGDGQFIFPPG